MDEPTRPIAVDDLESVIPFGTVAMGDGLEPYLEAMARALRPLAAADFSIAFIASGGFTGEFTGIEGYTAGWRDWLETFDSYETRLDGVQTGPEGTVLLTTQLGRGRGSSVEMETKSAAVVFWRDAQIRRIEFHLDRADALRAAGLSVDEPQSSSS